MTNKTNNKLFFMIYEFNPRLKSMNVIIASFAGNVQAILAIERTYPSDNAIFLVNANKKEPLSENISQAFNSLKEYYGFHNITPKIRLSRIHI